MPCGAAIKSLVDLDIIGSLASHLSNSVSLFYLYRFIRVRTVHFFEEFKDLALIRQRQTGLGFHKSCIDAACLCNGSRCPNGRKAEKECKGFTALGAEPLALHNGSQYRSRVFLDVTKQDLEVIPLTVLVVFKSVKMTYNGCVPRLLLPDFPTRPIKDGKQPIRGKPLKVELRHKVLPLWAVQVGLRSQLFELVHGLIATVKRLWSAISLPRSHVSDL
jgi:hypothetical protein